MESRTLFRKSGTNWRGTSNKFLMPCISFDFSASPDTAGYVLMRVFTLARARAARRGGERAGAACWAHSRHSSTGSS